MMHKTSIVFSIIASIFLVGLLWCYNTEQPTSHTTVSQAAEIKNQVQTAQVTVTNQASKRPIKVVIKGHVLKAHLYHNAAANQLYSQLPTTLKFQTADSNIKERTSDLKAPLSIKGMSAGENPKPGDIGYWSPQQRIVFYWGNVGYYEGIHVIGHFDTKQAAKIIKAQDGAFNAKVTKQ
ncbi:cyclophilin-like fold protein [Agrilactobacillus yilanensis]|uniref:Cyclophilin-like fold protein n=1 Tax=Agrilactobacillus yilanensis TaxID=2485997 RepID=A0ABW4J5R2_9LACO|nr:cyclophilin-like fold protein [Agrilactobacillus yilanensis]